MAIRLIPIAIKVGTAAYKVLSVGAKIGATVYAGIKVGTKIKDKREQRQKFYIVKRGAGGVLEIKNTISKRAAIRKAKSAPLKNKKMGKMGKMGDIVWIYGLHIEKVQLM